MIANTLGELRAELDRLIDRFGPDTAVGTLTTNGRYDGRLYFDTAAVWGSEAVVCGSRGLWDMPAEGQRKVVIFL